VARLALLERKLDQLHRAGAQDSANDLILKEYGSHGEAEPLRSAAFGGDPRLVGATWGSVEQEPPGKVSVVRPATTIATPPHEVQDVLDLKANGESAEVQGISGSTRCDDADSVGSPVSSVERGGVDVGEAKRRSLRRDGSQASCELLEQRTLHRRDSEVRVWKFLTDPESSKPARRWASLMPAVNIIAVFVTLSQALDPPLIYGFGAAVCEMGFEVFFALELIIRFICCPSRKKFMMSVHNWIDILAVAPLALRASIGCVIPLEEGSSSEFDWWARNLLICVVPIIRLLKTLRRFERFSLVGAAFEQAFEALPILLFCLFMLTLVFSALIYMVEPRDNIDSLQRAAWLTIVTMTTVGYGDTVPVTVPGSLVVTVLVISSVLYMAMPLGIVGQAFNRVWADRDRLLLVLRTKQRLKEWGYTARDVCVLFRWFDEDGSGELDIDEFHSMVDQMKLGLTKRRTVELFRGIDIDNGGTIDCKEFVKYLFPEDYYEIYGHEDDEDDKKSDDGKEDGEEDDPASPWSEKAVRSTGCASSSDSDGSAQELACSGNPLRQVSPMSPEQENPALKKPSVQCWGSEN
jgi:hypothetical protein